MPEQITYQQHDHFLRNMRLELEVQAKASVPNTHDPVQQRVQEDQHRFLNKVQSSFAESGKTDPKLVLQRAFSAFSELDQRRFILLNFLEAIKRNEPLDVTIRNYNKERLTTINMDNISYSDVPQSPDAPTNGLFLQTLLKQLTKVSIILIRIITNALRAIPNLHTIKPTLGLVGLVPSLSFELEEESMTVQELFDLLIDNL
jgi:hypothetical protein